jgi:CheY-like chemotaxis protein
MLNILLASPDKTSMAALKVGLEKHDVQTTWVETGGDALAIIAEKDFDLVVADENLGDMSGLEFIKTVITQNPMVSCAAISTLSPDEFHEASEGLGILMQLPVRPGSEYARKLLEHLKRILNLAIATS